MLCISALWAIGRWNWQGTKGPSIVRGSKATAVTQIPPRPPDALPPIKTKPTLPHEKVRHECLKHIRTRQAQVLNDLDRTTPPLLIDPAYHRNVGDSMITYGERSFLGSVDECRYVQAHASMPACRDDGQHSLWWHGGGNWGDLWPQVQQARIQSLEDFPDSSIISFPQSLYYRDKQRERQDAVVLNNARWILMWREHESFERAQELYPLAKHLLVPDIAFQLGPYESGPPQFDLLFLLRNDHESIYAEYRSRSALKPIVGDVSYTIVDWEDRMEIFGDENYLFTDRAIELLSMGRVVICDRLHAAILAYISGLPFVYLDQESGKVSKTLRVAFESWDGCQNGDASAWKGASTMPQAVERALELLQDHGGQVDRSSERRRKREALRQANGVV